MPRRIFDFDPPDRFVCGTVGPPGQRTFFLQAVRDGQVVSVALEKAQVAVLAERLASLLAGLAERGVEVEERSTAEAADHGPLSEPMREEFRVGTLSLAWDADGRRVIIEARELGPQDEAEAEEEALSAGDVDGPDVVRVHLPPAEARAFVVRAIAVVQAGRPPCPMCGAPLDASGHFCPRRNGYTH